MSKKPEIKDENKIAVGFFGRCLKCKKYFTPAWGWVDKRQISVDENRTELSIKTKSLLCEEHSALEKMSQ